MLKIRRLALEGSNLSKVTQLGNDRGICKNLDTLSLHYSSLHPTAKAKITFKEKDLFTTCYKFFKTLMTASKGNYYMEEIPPNSYF